MLKYKDVEYETAMSDKRQTQVIRDKRKGSVGVTSHPDRSTTKPPASKKE
jgi:hypothetical protein